MRSEHSRDGRVSETYEVHLQGTPPETLIARFAPTRVGRMPAQTVLMRRVASQDELATLLERVLALGLPLNEVHELRIASTAPRRVAGERTVHRAYEVRIGGQLDEGLLRFLRWNHRHLPEQAALRLEATSDEVHEFLGACCGLGLGIERVRRVAAFTPSAPPSATRN
jgi:hypothetical protein